MTSSLSTSARATVVEVPDRASLEALDTQTLHRELTDALNITARGLLRVAAIWTVLEERGEDLSHYRTGLAAYIPLIASNRLEPDLVVRLAGQRTVLREVAMLPRDRQQRLLAGEPIAVLAERNGELVEENVPIERLSASQAKLAMVDGSIRTPAEQRLVLTRSRRALRRHREASASGWRLDRETRSLVKGPNRVPLTDLTRALAELHEPHIHLEDGETVPVQILVTSEEHKQFKAAAAQAGHTMRDAARIALLQSGYLALS